MRANNLYPIGIAFVNNRNKTIIQPEATRAYNKLYVAREDLY